MKITKTVRTLFGKQFTYANRTSHKHNEFTAKNEKAVANVGRNTVKEITELASKFDDEPKNTAFTPRTYATSEQFTLYAVENKQVEATVNSMATHKTPGMEKIPVRVLKDCLPLILPSITSIINTSFATITFPEAGKLVEVTPIIKSGNHQAPNNNRPISLLSALSKVCARVAHNQFTTYQFSKERLTPKQSGNKHHHTNETTLIQTTDQILCAMGDKHLTEIVLLDMSKAFDSLHHGALLAKL